MVALILTLCAFPSPQTDRVLLVINQMSSASTQIGAYYCTKRQIPKNQIVFISTDAKEEIPEAKYKSSIEAPIRKAIKSSRKRVDFIVLTKGIPIRVTEGGYSVDALLAAMDYDTPKIADLKDENIHNARSPYFEKDEPFSSKKFGIYLVTRLDGYTVEDAKGLVDRSLAASNETGLFFFDEADNRRSGGYQEIQSKLSVANEMLKARGMNSDLDKSGEFVTPTEPLMGYVSWGSNDGAFEESRYKKIKFRPGAICETFVSTSGRTFLPTEGGQSLIADLIRSGVTGVKGYVSEPFTFALAKPDILFDRYTKGRNLAESFYAASMVLKWKDVVIGDPLCCPYAPR